MDEARRRLALHLSDSNARARDREVAGRRVRTFTYIFGGFTIIAAAIGLLDFAGSRSALSTVSGLIALVLGAVTALLLWVDLGLVPREIPATPDQTLKSWVKALATGRFGYAWASLAPTARDARLPPPQLGAMPPSIGQFAMYEPAAMNGYSQTFARPGQGQMRQLSGKHFEVVSVQGDVAVISCQLTFQSWPVWVSIVIAVGFTVIGLLALLGLVLVLVVRKKHVVTIQKTLLQGSDGAWYLLSADILEGSSR